MIPLEEYATIHQDASLYDAVLALENAQEEYCRPGRRYLHRAILVYDDKGKIVGKLSQLDILRGLEPKYKMISGGERPIHVRQFSDTFLQSMVRQFAFWDKPLSAVCKKATEMKAKDCMYIPTEGEYVQADDTLDMAVHQLVMGHHQSLLVVREERIVGILRLTDVFKHVANAMKPCKVE